MPKYRVMFARFPQHKHEDSECVDWLVQTAVDITKDERFALVGHKPFPAAGHRISDTPITMTRNQMFRIALGLKIDYLILVDSDMAPDLCLQDEHFDPRAKPFWQSSIEFMLQHHGPCVVAAPYCGPPPVENIYVFQWADQQSDHPNADHQIVQYTREQAALMSGIVEAAALPTGLMIIDMRAIEMLEPPYTYYEWKNDLLQDEKASTEDVAFTRDLSLLGVKQYCNWDAYAGHNKRKTVGKPRPICADMVAKKLHAGILSGRERGDRLADIKPAERFAADIANAIPGPPMPPRQSHGEQNNGDLKPMTMADLFT